MDIQAAILCDAATVREGLLHVLGGPITRMWWPDLPAPLNVALAAIVAMTEAERVVPHEVHVTVRNESHLLVEGMGALQAGELASHIEPDEQLLAPFAMPLYGVGTDQYGRHTLNLSIDNGSVERLVNFWVLHPDERRLPDPR